MKNIIKLLIRLVCMVCLAFMTVHTACAQSDEFATWTGVKLNYKVTSRWNLSGAAEFRSKNHLKEADRVSLNLGTGYNILSFLKLEDCMKYITGIEVVKGGSSDIVILPERRDI